MDDGSGSPLVQMFPYVALMLADEVTADIDRLLEHLLPIAREAEPKVSHAAAIAGDGRLDVVEEGAGGGWIDHEALSARLDELVVGGTVRAIACAEPVVARHTDGLSDAEQMAIHALVEHRAGLSHDYLVPFAWAPVRPPWVREPQMVDRIGEGRPYRAWPDGPSDVTDPWRMRPVGEVAEAYWAGRDYEELLRAVEIAEHTRSRLDEGDRAWAAATDQMAFLLAACFRHSGYAEDVERAVALGRAAAERDGSYRLHLAEYLGLRFLHTGDLADLEHAREEAEGAYNTASQMTEGIAATETVVDLLLAQYRATADEALLGEAGRTLGNAAQQIPEDGDLWTPRLFGQFAALSLILFELRGEREHLEGAVSYSAQALDATDQGSPAFPRRLRDHGIALLRSYRVTDDESQLAHAYRVLNWAREQTHANSPERASILLPLAATELHPLPLAPVSRGLLEASAQHERAPVASAAWGLLSNAAAVAEEALATLPEGALERPEARSLMASAYRERFALAGELDDLRLAAASSERAVEEWGAAFAVAPVAAKLGSSRSGHEIHTEAVETLLMLAAADATGADRAHRRALELAEAAKSRLLTEQLSREALPSPPDVPDALVGRERSLLAELMALDTAALVARGSGVAVRTDSQRRAALMMELGQVWDAIAEVSATASEYVAVRRGSALSWSQIAKLVERLGPGTAVVVVSLLRSQTAVFVLRDGTKTPEVTLMDLGETEWDEALRRFESELPVSGGVDDFPPTWQGRLRPFLDAVAGGVQGCKRVVVVPHRGAQALPWTLLSRDWNGQGGASPAVSTVPALALLDRLHRRPATSRRAAVVIGNPTGDLEHAEAEARAVASALGVEPLIGAAATQAAVAAAVASAGVVHVAGHASFDADSPLDASVALCDGPWSARAALEAQLEANLVVLSGCVTGLAGALAGDEQAGLTQAFLHAGARSLVVSLWQVDDAATADLMCAFHQQRLTGATAADALAAAVEHVREAYEHPWFWSAFTLVGDAR